MLLDDVHWLYRYEEISDLALSGICVSVEELNKRRDCWLLMLNDGGMNLELLTGRKAKDYRGSIEVESDMHDVDDILQGSVASMGTHRGIARVVMAGDASSSKEFRDSVQDGDIVVSQMTQPDLVDILSRCGGIITDEGGILCHAAIIAREFRVPCVVGTAVATKTILSGDDIEILSGGKIINYSAIKRGASHRETSYTVNNNDE